LRTAHAAAPNDGVRQKYEWLCRYARKYAETEFPQFDAECFCWPSVEAVADGQV